MTFLCPTCEAPAPNGAANKLVIAATHIPPGFHLKFEVFSEEDESGKGVHHYLSASVFQDPPEEGWSVRGIDPPPHLVYHPSDKFTERVLWSITGANPEAFERLLYHSIITRWPSPGVDLWDA